LKITNEQQQQQQEKQQRISSPTQLQKESATTLSWEQTHSSDKKVNRKENSSNRFLNYLTQT
jgi:hypothetical protein